MRRFIKLLNGFWTATTRIAILSAIVTVAVVVCRDIVGDTLLIETISVPKVLETDGLGSDAVATRLRSELTILKANAGTKMRSPSVAASGTGGLAAPDIVVPGTGVTVGSLSTWIGTRVLTQGWRHFLHMPERKTASGEIRQVGNSFRLTLRLNDKSIYETPRTFGEEGIDQEIRTAAIELAKQTFPYIYASYLYGTAHGDLATVKSLLDWIIRTYPATDENVIRAHNLRGLILQEQLDYPDAAEEFAWADRLATEAGLPDTYIISNLAWNVALAAEADQKQQNLTDEQFLKRVEQARNIASMVTADGSTHYLLGLINWLEASIADSRSVQSRHTAAAKREFDVATTFPDPNENIFRQRAEFLEWAAELHDDASNDSDTIITDRRIFLLKATNAKHHIEGLPGEYAKLAAALIRQEQDIAVNGPRMIGKDSIIVIAAGGAIGPVFPPILTHTIDSSTEATMQRGALLMEACASLRIALRLWNAGDNKDVPHVIDELATVYKASKTLDPAARSCLASPGPAPEAADDQ